MESVPATEFDLLRLRYRAINANRPTVIIFSGLQNNDGRYRRDEDGATEMKEQPDSIFQKHNTDTTKFHQTTGLECRDDEYESEDGEQYETNVEDRTHFPEHNGILDNTKPRQRTSFTKTQRIRLEEEFNRDAYIIGMKRWRLSVELAVPEKKIKIWFQNRRTKMKKGY